MDARIVRGVGGPVHCDDEGYYMLIDRGLKSGKLDVVRLSHLDVSAMAVSASKVTRQLLIAALGMTERSSE